MVTSSFGYDGNLRWIGWEREILLYTWGTGEKRRRWNILGEEASLLLLLCPHNAVTSHHYHHHRHHPVHLNIPAVFIFWNICSAKTAQSLLIGEVPSSFPRDTSRLGWAGPGCLLPTLHIHTRGITGRRRDAWVSPWCIIYTHLCVCVCEMILSNRIQSSAADGYVIFVHTRSIDARERVGNCSTLLRAHIYARENRKERSKKKKKMENENKNGGAMKE